MKKIYWFLRQTHKLAGTEMVTLNIVNLLAKERQINLVVMGQKYENMPFPISEDVNTIYLNIPYKYSCIDEYAEEVNPIVRPFALMKGSMYWIFKRFKNRKIIKSMTTKDDILIFSAYDNYLCAPKDRRVLFHFHFNAKFFLKPSISLGRMFHRKPDKYIFLTKETKLKIEAKKKNVKDSYFVHNPIRFDSNLNLDYHNNEIIFIGRFTAQKDPILALQIMLELKKLDFKAHLSMYGAGELENKMKSFIEKNKLNDFVTLKGTSNQLKEKLNESDLLLCTSTFEGFHLGLNEANSQSVPAISTNWGDAIKEVLDNGENGFIIESRNPKDIAVKIKEILLDLNYLKDLRQKTYNHFNKHSNSEYIKKCWISIFNEEDKISI